MIDEFVAKKDQETVYVQDAYLLADDKVIEREFGAFDYVKDNYPKYVITLDEYDNENDLTDTAANALAQIEEKKYAADLIAQGIPENNILKYGFAFQGKKCLIRGGRNGSD